MNQLNSYELDTLNETTAFFLKQTQSNRGKGSKVMSFFEQKLDKNDLFKKLLECTHYLFNFSSNCGAMIVQEKRLLKKAAVTTINEIKLFELKQCEALNHKLSFGQQFQHVSFGAATGAIGLPGLLIDVAASPALKNKSILEIGLAYGFDKFEAQLNGFSALLIDSVDGMYERVQIIGMLNEAKKLVLKKIEEKSKDDLTELFLKKLFKSDAAVKALVKLFEKLGIKVTEKTLGKIVPLIGGFFGGALSYKEYNYIATLYKHHFRLVWLKERNKITETEYQNILVGKPRLIVA